MINWDIFFQYLNILRNPRKALKLSKHHDQFEQKVFFVKYCRIHLDSTGLCCFVLIYSLVM